jgi:uncharacterized protein (DUF433 family)
MRNLPRSTRPGEAIFPGTTIPVASLLEHLQDGGSLAEFLELCPQVNPADAEKTAASFTHPHDPPKGVL